MKIRDIEVDFDFLDADNIEKFENSAKKVVEQCSNSEIKTMSMAEALRKECEIIDAFLDDVFGEGTSKNIFKGKMNLGEHIHIFEEIVKAKNEKQNELQQTLNRYRPNREQRRNKGKR